MADNTTGKRQAAYRQRQGSTLVYVRPAVKRALDAYCDAQGCKPSDALGRWLDAEGYTTQAAQE